MPAARSWPGLVSTRSWLGDASELPVDLSLADTCAGAALGLSASAMVTSVAFLEVHEPIAAAGENRRFAPQPRWQGRATQGDEIL